MDILKEKMRNDQLFNSFNIFMVKRDPLYVASIMTFSFKKNIAFMKKTTAKNTNELLL